MARDSLSSTRKGRSLGTSSSLQESRRGGRSLCEMDSLNALLKKYSIKKNNNTQLPPAAVACHWTSYSVKERYDKNDTSVSTEISINIPDNWMSVGEKNFLKSRKMKGQRSPVHNLHLASAPLRHTVIFSSWHNTIITQKSELPPSPKKGAQ